MNCDHGAMRPRHTKCPDCGEPRPTKYLLAKDNGKVRVLWDDTVPGWLSKWRGIRLEFGRNGEGGHVAHEKRK
jgi:hypothetical protein